jgi:endonuclease-8
MPEGDALHRAAERLRVLEGEVVTVESPHPRAAVLGIAPKLDGKRLERVEAVGKNLLLTFESGLVLRSHLRMRGRWQVREIGATRAGRPWLVLRGRVHEALLWNGPVLELGRGPVDRLGPDIMADAPDLDGMVARLRRTGQGREVGEALVDQRLVAGIGNMWKAEALFLAQTSPWRPLAELRDEELGSVLRAASEAMRAARTPRWVYRRAGLPCRRCGTAIASRRQGDDARTAYWCPACQAGTPRDSA